MKVIINIVCFAIYFSFLLTSSISKSEVVPKILILHSYHQGAPWTDHIMEGMLSVLKPTDNKMSIHTEYLDALRTPKEFWPDFGNYLTAKYTGEKFDVILASDDDILDFLLPRYKDLFPTTPIIFCGINNLDENNFKKHDIFKGINQEIDAKGTIEFALKLQPLTEKFLVISDRTSAGMRTTKKFKEDIKNLGPLKPAFELIDDFTLPELKAHLQALGPKDLVLVLRLQQIKGIDERSPAKFLKIITDTAPVPAFKVWGTGKTDFSGGVYVSSFSQGKTAAEIGLRILRGENLSNMPQVIASPNVPTLNYAILKKFHIDPKNIPEGTTIINPPIPFLDRYRHLALLVLSIFIVLVVIIFSLVIIIFNKKKSEKKIYESRQLYKHLFEHAPVGIAIADSNNRYLDVNKILCKMFGYSREQFIGLHALDIVSPNKNQHIGTAFSKKLVESRYDRQWKGKRQDGSTLTAEILVSKMPDGSFLFIIEDITDQLEEEKRIKELEKQLFQSQKLESIGILAGGVAHDYNNISSIIIGYTELALESVDQTDRIQSDLTEILAAAKRATNITRQLLAFARQQTIAPRVLDINEAIEGLLKMIRRLIGEDIDVVWLPGTKIWPLKLDPSQVDQILANLCVNARDAVTDVGKVTIETQNVSLDAGYCATHTDFTPGTFVLLTVSDNGKGMTPETQEKIFEPFFTTKGVGQGTGLGLATVYGIVKQNNGFINVYSELNKGTTIKVYLPRYTGKDVQAQKYDVAENQLGDGEKILLVEDDAAMLKLEKTILEDLAYSVVATTSPIDAVTLAKEHIDELSLLLTDVVMPEMNGRVLSEMVQAISPDIKILFMSGYTANVIAHRGVLDDGVHFISKPFTKKEIAMKVQEVLKSKKSL